MRNNIKYSASSIIIILSLMLGYIAYAEDTTTTNLGQRIQSIKDKRAEFKTEIESIKEQTKLKIDEVKNNFKESLKNIKDENKKISAEKIVDIIQGLNTKKTDNFSAKIDKIENVLVSIESRIAKAESNGLDVSLVKIEVGKATVAITQARAAVSVQSMKIYSVNVTSEATLKSEMKNLRDTFQKDMKALNAVVKSAHEAVRNTATTLAKIPKIDEDGINNKVEDNKTTDSN